MIIFLLFLTSIFAAAFQLPDFSADLATPFQKICTGLSPVNSIFHELYTATICGVNPTNSELMWEFRNTGLFHLIVVSGAHLSFLGTLVMLTPLPRKKNFLILILCTYALASGLNPPVLRALIAYLLYAFQKRYHLGWSNYSVVIGSGLLCLTVFPSWWTSISFLMSWLASLAVILPGSPLRKAAYCYLLMLLPMSQFQWNHPLTVVFNLLLAPLLGFIVLPFSLLPFFVPPLLFVSDWVWKIVTEIIHFTSQIVSSATPLLPISSWIIWILLFGLHLALYHYNVRQRRSEWKIL